MTKRIGIKTGCPRCDDCDNCPYPDCQATAQEICRYDDSRSAEKKRLTAAQAKKTALELYQSGVTLKDIAQQVGVSSATVSAWVAETYNPERYAQILARRKASNKRYNKPKEEAAL